MFAVQLICYGYPVKSPDDECLQLVRESLENFTLAGKLGSHLVDFFPFCKDTISFQKICLISYIPSNLLVKYIPEWVPGAGFQREARRMRDTLNKSTRIPYEWTKKHLVSTVIS